MPKILYRQIFKRSFNLILLLAQVSLLSAQESQEIDFKKKAYLKEIETSTDEDLIKWAESEGIREREISKVKLKLLEKFGIDPQLLTMSFDGKKFTGRYKILIENTENLENFVLEKGGDEIISFKGNVHLNIEDTLDETKHSIKASNISFNTNNKKLIAKNKVEYSLKTSSSDDPVLFFGEELFIDLKNEQFILKEGVSQSKLSFNVDNVVLSFGGRELKRNDLDVSLLRDAFITTSKIEDPYYQIKASKIWILPSGDFGFLNATFYIGRVPIFYFPFFFKTGDSLINNPAFYYDSKKGISLFNTFYLYGKRLHDEKNFLDFNFNNFFNRSKKPKLRNAYLTYFLSEEKLLEESKDYFKVFFDIYSNLGIFSGFSFDYKELFSLEEFQGTFGLGFSAGEQYRRGHKFDLNHIHKSKLFNIELPIRYLLDFTLKQDFAGFKTNFNFEYYSDDLVKKDFLMRVESLVLDYNVDESDFAINEHFWNISSYYSFNFKDFISVEFKLNKLGLKWDKAKETLPPTNYYRKSFSIKELLLPDFELIYKQELFNLIKSKKGFLSNLSSDLKPIFTLPEKKDTQKPKSDEITYLKPSLFSKSSSLSSPLLSDFTINFLVNPYIRNNLLTDDAQNFKIKNYIIDFSNTLKLGLDFKILNKFLNFSSDFYVRNIEYLNLDKDLKEDSKNSKASHKLEQILTLTLYPLLEYEDFKHSYIKYYGRLYWYELLKKLDTKSRELVWQQKDLFSNFKSMLYQDFEYELKFLKNIFSSSVKGKTKNRDNSLFHESIFNLGLNFDYIEQEAGFSLSYDLESKLSKLDPLYYEIRFLYKELLKASSKLEYDIEKYSFSALNLNFKLLSLSFDFLFKKTKDYKWDKTSNDFEPKGSEEYFLPHYFKLAYKDDFYTINLFNDKFKIKFEIDTAWHLYIQKFIDNSFSFGLNLKFEFENLFEFFLKSYSENTKTYKYFSSFTAQYEREPTNVLEDLLISFNFFNENDRKRSNFKIKEFNIGFKLNFYDWNLFLESKLKPVLNLKNKTYSWEQDFYFYINWNFFEPIKTSLKYKDSEFSINENNKLD